jgi:cell division protein FtsQ
MQRISPISKTAVTQRTRKLRRQRWGRAFNLTWRSLWVFILAAGLLWLLTQPNWVIYRPEQVIIRGNQFFSATAIRSLLPLTYPQSLLKLQPQAIATQLEAKGPIASAIVTRNLLPPSLTVDIKERRPVAVSIPNPAAPSLDKSRPSLGTTEGLIDEMGVWMPRDSYAALGLPLPSLRVIGLNSEVYPHWQEMYQILSKSPAKITEIDCRNPSNIILTTNLGKAHLGRYSNNFAQQIRILETMQRVPQQLKDMQIGYIDLRDIDRPQIRDVK